jgi:hypothetical protein
MKKKQITFDKKLSLDFLIISKLDAYQMDAIAGGMKTIVPTLTCINRYNEEVGENEDISCISCSCNG